ncbi:hypothetical protein E2C01_049585 [Portunus trituberculatus]|uniref:Uncharacterized protein n=1 Tax=Portunus trituberculatus TaxID=210409 RepID=A0A5B7GEB7_PORTR|nr:hypothetical protein [Portunus trituberculatus]
MVQVRCVTLTHFSMFLPPIIPPCLLVGIGNRSVGKRRAIPWKPVVQLYRVLLLGMQRGEILATTPRFRRVHPLDSMMSQTSETLTLANEFSKSSFTKYPARQYYISYRTSVDEDRSLPARVNSDLVQHLTVRGDS